jgi:prolyl oligopeptidase
MDKTQLCFMLTVVLSLTPSFSINAVWLENGGVYAVPNLRGGGEYGKKWHDAGTKMQKTKCI